MGLKTASQNAKFQYEAKGRSPPGFSLQVSRFRTPARFLFQMVTYQFWLETVKTGGGYPLKMCSLPCFAFVSLLYLWCLLLIRRQT